MSDLTRSAAILAGGQATRFGGRDKSALLVDGRAITDAERWIDVPRRVIGATAEYRSPQRPLV